MNIKGLLPFIVSGILPLTAFSQDSSAPSANVGAALAPRSSGEAAKATGDPAPDTMELTRLLKEFLAGASRNDPAMHDRFWAEDLIYTSALGRRKGKADIMRELRAEAATPADEETSTYSAEDIRIQQYGATAIVAFRLVGTTRKGEKTEVANYLNTGTFLQRDGTWQAVSWQATKMPAENEPTK